MSWLDNTTEGRDHVRTKTTAQMMINRRLMVIKEVIAEYQLTVKFNLVQIYLLKRVRSDLTKICGDMVKYYISKYESSSPNCDLVLFLCTCF